MFESIRKKIEEHNKDNHPNNISFDFKLMFVYHIAMMILLGTRVLDSARPQVWFATLLGIVLLIVSCVYKVKKKWKWPGLAWYSIPAAILNLVLIYGFLAVSSYLLTKTDLPELDFVNIKAWLSDSWGVLTRTASTPYLTPWYLGAVGIGVFNFLSAINFSQMKKTEFDALCEPNLES